MCPKLLLLLLFYLLLPSSATRGQLQAATLYVRVFYQSVGTASSCIYLAFTLMRSTKLLSDSTLQPKNMNQTPNYLYSNKTSDYSRNGSHSLTIFSFISRTPPE